ncbi:unnamed protein product [Coccothraustes coccothraustes]
MQQIPKKHLKPRQQRTSRNSGPRSRHGSSTAPPAAPPARRGGAAPETPARSPCPAGPAPRPERAERPAPAGASAAPGPPLPPAGPAQLPSAPHGSHRRGAGTAAAAQTREFPVRPSQCPGAARSAPERDRSVPGRGHKKRPRMQRHSPTATLQTLREMEAPAIEPRN